MPLEHGVRTNPDDHQRNCSKLGSINLGLPAYSAPQGTGFLNDSGLPKPWKNGAVVTLHGCWNCTRLNGHKLVFILFSAKGQPEQPIDMVSDWMTDANAHTRKGRPVDAIPSPLGRLYISDGFSGTIYEMYSK